jgi:hypothetical protein
VFLALTGRSLREGGADEGPAADSPATVVEQEVAA